MASNSKQRQFHPDIPLTGKCVIYVRVSTKYQVMEGISIQSQINECRAYADRKGLVVTNVFADKGKSGTRLTNRPGFKAAFDLIKKGDVFLIYSISRASRSIKDLTYIFETLDARGAKILSSKETLDGEGAQGFLNRNFFFMMAEYESKLICDRVSDTMQYRKQAIGTANNRLGYGWIFSKEEDEKGFLIPMMVLEEQRVIYQMLKKRAEMVFRKGTKNFKDPKDPKKERAKIPTPYSEIARWLNEDLKIPTRTRKADGSSCRWHAQTVKNILDGLEKLNEQQRQIYEDFDWSQFEEADTTQKPLQFIALDLDSQRKRMISAIDARTLQAKALDRFGPDVNIYVYQCNDAETTYLEVQSILIANDMMKSEDLHGFLRPNVDKRSVLDKINHYLEVLETAVMTDDIISQFDTKA